MDGAVTLSIATILAWSMHVVVYVRYAVAFHPKLRTKGFIAGHCLEVSLIFGAFYAIGLMLAESPSLHDLLIAAGATLLLDVVTYALARDFFRPLMSPMNALLPPMCAVLTVVGVYLLFA